MGRVYLSSSAYSEETEDILLRFFIFRGGVRRVVKGVERVVRGVGRLFRLFQERSRRAGREEVKK